MKRILILLLFPWFANAIEPKVLFVIIDGVRNLEMQGQAKDDEGKTVSLESLFPHITKYMKKGLYVPNLYINNPVGISLPAYADYFAGRRQEKIVSNNPPDADLHSHFPTIFHTIREKYNSSDAAALFSPWNAICKISSTGDKTPNDDFFRDCGWEAGKYFKSETYPGTRTDMDNFIEVMKEVPKRHPRLMFVHLLDADTEGHLHKKVEAKTRVYYGIYPYHAALRESDYYVGRIWKMLQEDPFYKDSTTLIIATDHGRDNVPEATQWADHGECVHSADHKLCSGCQHAFAIFMGPGIPHKVLTEKYHQIDMAPTIAERFGLKMPTAMGAPIPLK